MATANSTFAERLNEAFEHRGITDTQEKIKRLEAATGRKARTAARWLNGSVIPRNSHTVILITDDLHISIDWLIAGVGYSPLQYDLYEKLSQVPKEYLPKLTRYYLRLLNNDPKAQRWSAMHERGELDMRQILAMA